MYISATPNWMAVIVTRATTTGLSKGRRNPSNATWRLAKSTSRCNHFIPLPYNSWNSTTPHHHILIANNTQNGVTLRKRSSIHPLSLCTKVCRQRRACSKMAAFFLFSPSFFFSLSLLSFSTFSHRVSPHRESTFPPFFFTIPSPVHTGVHHRTQYSFSPADVGKREEKRDEKGGGGGGG